MTQQLQHPKKDLWLYPLIRRFIKCEPREQALVWDGTIYAPQVPLAPDVYEHELVHVEQQKKMGSMRWWMRYLLNKDFRLEQELEAHAHQYGFICSIEHDRNFRSMALRNIARNLSSPIYGSLLTQQEAMHLIEKKAGKAA